MTARSVGLQDRSRSPVLPGVLLGLGLGGFVDAIVLHQVLQWHHLVSHVDRYPVDTVAGLEANTLADGLLQAVTWLLVLAGLVLTVGGWRQGRSAPSWRSQAGLLLAGWGVFNLVEGVVDHQLLGIHHVRDDLGGPPVWDVGWLLFGAVLVAVGAALHRAGLVRRPVGA